MTGLQLGDSSQLFSWVPEPWVISTDTLCSDQSWAPLWTSIHTFLYVSGEVWELRLLYGSRDSSLESSSPGLHLLGGLTLSVGPSPLTSRPWSALELHHVVFKFYQCVSSLAHYHQSGSSLAPLLNLRLLWVCCLLDCTSCKCSERSKKQPYFIRTKRNVWIFFHRCVSLLFSLSP